MSLDARNDLDVALFLDLRGLATELAQVVQLGATDVTARDDLDVVDDRGVDGELTLDTDLEADLADGEGFADAIALTTRDDTLENLDTAAAAFNDVDVDLHVVTDTEIGDVALERCGIDCIELLHFFFRFLHSPQVDCGLGSSRRKAWLLP